MVLFRTIDDIGLACIARRARRSRKIPGCLLRLPLLVTGVTGVAKACTRSVISPRAHPGQVIGSTRPHQTRFVSPAPASCRSTRRTPPACVDSSTSTASAASSTPSATAPSSRANSTRRWPEPSTSPAACRSALIDSAATRHGSRVVHLSSDLVFSGSHTGNYRETDSTDPVTVYGETMVEAERLFAERLPATAILRISLPMGPSFNRHAGAIDWIQSRFRNGRPATLYFDEVRSAAYVDDLTRVFVRFLAGSESGLHHLGGPRAVPLHQIAQIDQPGRRLRGAVVARTRAIEAGPMPPRAGNVHDELGQAGADVRRRIAAGPVAARRATASERPRVAPRATGGRDARGADRRRSVPIRPWARRHGVGCLVCHGYGFAWP